MDKNVSVIMPCYNQEEFVLEAIQSVIDQTYQNWELIIVNDGSTDNSKNVIVNYLTALEDSRISFHSIKNSGVSHARNFAIRKSSGEYILPLDADDKLHPLYLENTVEIMTSDENLIIVYSEVEFFGAKHGKLNVREFSYKNILLNNIIVCTALFKRADFDKTDGYDTSFVYGWEDWDFWLCLLKVTKGSAFKIPETLFYYRIKQNSRNQTIDNEKQWQNDTRWKIFIKHLEWYKSTFDDPISTIIENGKLINELKFIKRKPIKYWLNRCLLYKKALLKIK
jgi:glycosyltransferase involved in cell wall biosynthesis